MRATLPFVNSAHAGPASGPALGPKPESVTRRRIRRTAALTGLCEAQLRTLLGVKLARIVGLLVAVGFGCAMLVLFTSAGRDVLDVLCLQALAWLSWLAAGIAALSAAQDLAARDRRDGIAALALQRGHDQSTLAYSRLLATVRVIARVTLGPALALALLAMALSGSVAVAASRALLAAGVFGYVLLLGAVLGGLARWAVMLSPNHGRSVLVALVIGPHLARTVWPQVPSIPAWFEALLAKLLQMGMVLG